MITSLPNPENTVAIEKPKPPPKPKVKQENDYNDSPNTVGDYLEVNVGPRRDANGSDYETIPAPQSEVYPDTMTSGNSSTSSNYEHLAPGSTSSANVRNEYEQLRFEV